MTRRIDCWIPPMRMSLPTCLLAAAWFAAPALSADGLAGAAVGSQPAGALLGDAFVGNAGQRDPGSAHRWRGGALTADFGRDAICLSLDGGAGRGHAVFLRFEDAGGAPRAAAALTGEGPLPGHVNVYRGAVAHLDVPLHARLRYRGLLPGLDLQVRAEAGVLEYDLLAAPGADPAALVLRVEGGGALRLAGDGTLVVPTGVGDLVQVLPAAWERLPGGGRRPLAARFELLDACRFRLVAEGRDERRPLVIDPQLTFSSYLGGSNIDYVTDVVVGAGGQVHLTGLTASPGFPVTPGAWDRSTQGISDAFVARLDPATGALGYATFFGGADTSVLQSERGVALAVDAAGHAFVGGWATSPDFPTSPGAFQQAPNGGRDAFAARFDAAGQRVWCTRLGGSADDVLQDVALGAGGELLLVGSTTSGAGNFPTTPGAFDETGQVAFIFNDGFAARLSAQGDALVWSTFLAGAGRDEAWSVAVDAADRAVVAGFTGSSDFPTTPGAFDESFNGQTQSDEDAFVLTLAQDGGALAWGTFLGGAGEVMARAVAVAPDGGVLVAGETASGDLPMGALGPGTWGATFQGGNAMGTDGFVARLSGAGATLDWLGYLGGGEDDFVAALAVTTAGAPTLAGSTRSGDFPAGQETLGPGAAQGGDDAFIARVSHDGARLLFTARHGGGGDDLGYGLALDVHGGGWLVGQTASANLPVTANATDASYNASVDGFVARFDVPPWSKLGFAKPGTGGVAPTLVGTGSLEAFSPGTLTLGAMPPSSLCLVVVSFALTPVPFEGGTLAAFPIAFQVVLPTGTGTLPLAWSEWPEGVPSGFDMYFHVAVADPGAIAGISMTNALQATMP